ncbi:DeoR/GlpR family transcriptional regulator, partial [Enterobacter intestinihominis]
SMVNAVYTDEMPPPGVLQVIKDNNLQLEFC